jgi:glycerol uptake facilitator-like aquaporin
MVYATGHLSGAHLKPAVTLSYVLARHIPVRRMAGYGVAQLAGRLSQRSVCGCALALWRMWARLCPPVLTSSHSPWRPASPSS